MITATTAVEIENVDIESLHPDPANTRRIGERELEALTRSLKEFSFVQPVLARRNDNVVIGGHQRLLAARRLGRKEVPVIYLDLSAEQSRLLNLALNKISGEWDQELLARMLADLKPVEEIDLSLSGFSEEELGKLLKSLDLREKKERVESFDVDAALKAAQSAPVAKRGDLWHVGDHRLLCGDSTEKGDVAQLMGKEKARLMATDPPYLVDYQGGNHPTSKANKGRPTKDKHWDDYHDPEAAVEFFAKFQSWPRAPSRQRRRLPVARDPTPGPGRAGLDAVRSARPPDDHLGQGEGRPHPLPLPLAARALLLRLERREAAFPQTPFGRDDGLGAEPGG